MGVGGEGEGVRGGEVVWRRAAVQSPVVLMPDEDVDGCGRIGVGALCSYQS